MEDSEDKPTSYVGLIIFVITLPLLLFFSYIGKTDLGLSIGICLGIALVVVRIYWNLRSRVWFWAVIAILLLLHIPLAMKVRWPDAWVPRVALLPIGLADIFIYVGVIKLVETMIGKDHTSDEDTEK